MRTSRGVSAWPVLSVAMACLAWWDVRNMAVGGSEDTCKGERTDEGKRKYNDQKKENTYMKVKI